MATFIQGSGVSGPSPNLPISVYGCGDSGLPSGYKKLEYIESTGTQYIDTGFAPLPTDDFEIKLCITEDNSNGCFFGASNIFQWTTVNSAIALSQTTDKNIYFRYGNNPTTIRCMTIADTPIIASLRGTTLTIGNNTETITRESSWSSTVPTLYLFNRHLANPAQLAYCKGRIYYLKWFSNNALVRNMIPAKNSSNVVGMYDLVTNTFFTNAGEGDFIAGPEDTSCVVPVKVTREVPLAYKQLEYIESTGTQYIDTGINVGTTSNFNLDLDFSTLTTPPTTDAKAVFSCKEGWVYNAYCLLYRYNTNDFRFNGTNLRVGDFSVNTRYRYTTHYSDNTGTLLSEDGTEYTHSLGDNSNLSTLKIFGVPATDKCINMLLHRLKCYSGTTLIGNFIPAKRNSDSVLGMYDLVTDTFFTNQGTGTFTAGPEVGTVYNINLPAPLQKVGTYADSIESDGTLTRGVGKITLSAGTHTISDAMSNSPYLCTQQVAGTLSGQNITLDTGVNNADVYYVKAVVSETTVQVPTISTAKGANYIAVETEVQPSNMSVTYRKKTK